MADRSFGPEERARVLQNRNVLKVSDTTITYCSDFKVRAVRENLVESKTPQDIFLTAGFDLDLIGRETPKRCLNRWRAICAQRGEEGLRDDHRGKAKPPAERELTAEEKLRRLEARVRYLEKENELLKKTRRDRKGRG